MSNMIWSQVGGKYLLSYRAIEHDKLENAVYTVGFNDRDGFFLVKISDNFMFDYKVYGLEKSFIDRVIKTYGITKGNLGILLNGTRGTGKTVTSKILANKLDQPTIVISEHMKGLEKFVNSIPQDINVFIDEYEKIYKDSNIMLTIMDGAMNSEYRRMFLMTTNRLNVEENMKERPGRVRYIKEFGDLPVNLIEEIVDDCLEHEELRDDCIKFISTLEIITVDIVKAVLGEVNIHHETPFNFEDVFNVKKADGKYKVYQVDKGGKESVVMDNVHVWPNPKYGSSSRGRRLELDGKTVGEIVKSLGPDTIQVKFFDIDKNGDKTFNRETVLKVEKSWGYNEAYAYSADKSYGYGKNQNAPKTTKEFMDFITPKRAIKKKESESVFGNEITQITPDNGEKGIYSL